MTAILGNFGHDWGGTVVPYHGDCTGGGGVNPERTCVCGPSLRRAGGVLGIPLTPFSHFLSSLERQAPLASSPSPVPTSVSHTFPTSRLFLRQVFDNLNPRSMLDVPCGDMVWMPYTNLSGPHVRAAKSIPPLTSKPMFR